MTVIVSEPYGTPRQFDTLPKAKAHMKKKVQDQMAFCRKYANDSVESVGDLLSTIESLNDGSFEYGPVRLEACVDKHTNTRMRFTLEVKP